MIKHKEYKNVFIGIGSNQGDRKSCIFSALEEIRSFGDLVSISGLYETEPFGSIEQSDFLNAVVQVSTALAPDELLTRLQHVEQRLGRVRKEKWGPRTLDLDILIFDQLLLKSETLVVPHPGLSERLFVLVPLCEIASQYNVPGLNKTVEQLLKETPDGSRIELYATSNAVWEKLKEV